MQFADYRDRYHTIRLTRSDEGVLELVMHTRGGEALWGTSTRSLHAELGQCFADIARDRENKVVILTGYDTESAWREGLRSGADLFAVKPVNRERIRVLLTELLSAPEGRS